MSERRPQSDPAGADLGPIVRALEERYGLNLNEDARRWEEEGLLNGLRAVFYLLFRRANRGRFSEDEWMRRDAPVDLTGSWLPITRRTVNSVQHDLRVSTDLAPGDSHYRLAQQLEHQFRLSDHVRAALMDDRIVETLAVVVLAAEAHFFEELGRSARHEAAGEQVMEQFMVEETTRTEGAGGGEGSSAPVAEPNPTVDKGTIQEAERRWLKWWG